MYSILESYRTVFAGQWWNRERIRRMQERRLVRLVRHAYETVPYYRRLFDGAGVSPAAIRTLDDLRRLPLTTKWALRQHDPGELISSRFRRAKLEHDSSSGSSGTPFSVYLDKRYVLNRNMRFLRGLIAAGYRPGDRMLLITDRHGGQGKSWMRWEKASPEETADRLLQRIDALRPAVLYGSGTPLRQLADMILDTGSTTAFLKSVVWTAETLDERTRQRLERAFSVAVFDFYGLTEMGLVAWECEAHAGYHVSDDSVILEYVPISDPAGPRRIVITNLALYSMPLIRYDTGDLGTGPATEPCVCGRGLSRLDRVDGRVVDTIRLRSGEVLSPYAFICKLETLEGLQGFQVVQDSYDEITVFIDTRPDVRARVERHVRQIVNEIVGNRIDLSVADMETPHPQPNGKFRAVRSRVEQRL
jgi:phenylacetate-CoA ligase